MVICLDMNEKKNNRSTANDKDTITQKLLNRFFLPCGRVGHEPGKNPLTFGVNLDKGLDPRIGKIFFYKTAK